MNSIEKPNKHFVSFCNNIYNDTLQISRSYNQMINLTLVEIDKLHEKINDLCKTSLQMSPDTFSSLTFKFSSWCSGFNSDEIDAKLLQQRRVKLNRENPSILSKYEERLNALRKRFIPLNEKMGSLESWRKKIALFKLQDQNSPLTALPDLVQQRIFTKLCSEYAKEIKLL